MGSKISKRGSQEPDNDLSSKSHVPFQFLDTGTMQSSCVPKMIKMLLKPQQDGRWPVSTSSLAFLKNEKYILFGSVDAFWSIDVEGLGARWVIEDRASDNLCLIDLHSGKMYDVFGNSVRDICVSSNNEYVAILTYSGYSHLQLWQWISEKLDFVDETVQQCSASHSTCCSISPNGKWLVLAICSDFFTIRTKNYLEIYTVNKSKLDMKEVAAIFEMFSMSSVQMFIISLEFSSDSEILAVGTHAGRRHAGLYLISTKTWKPILNVTEKMERFSFIPFIWGVFNPLLSKCHELIALTKCGHLQKWDTSSLYDDQTRHIESIDNMNVTHDISNDPEVVSCPRFSSDGNLFAVPLSNGDVIILDPNLFQILWTILCPDFQSELDLANIPQHLEATSVCFSKSCEYLAVGYSGSIVSVWMLPRMHFTLKHLCRTNIISMFAPKSIHKLPIPEALKQYLLYQL